MLKKPPSAYYKISALAEEWEWNTSDILDRGEKGEIQICVLLAGLVPMIKIKRRLANESDRKSHPCLKSIEKKLRLPPNYLPINEPIEFVNGRGLYPLYQGDIPHICSGKGITQVKDLDYNDPVYDILYYFCEYFDTVEDYSITSKKFQPSDLVITHKERLRFEKECARKKEMGTEERENLLRLIGALIEQNYQGVKYRKENGSPNASAISNKFHGWLIDNYFSDKGISDKSFRKLIPEAYNLIMENKEEKTKVVTLKQKLPA